MINTGLDTKYEGKQNKQTNSFEPVPAGNYLVKVQEVKPWQSVVKDVYVNQRDEYGRLVRDTNNKIVKQLVKGLEYYRCNAVLVIEEGEHKGRRLFTNLTTHPNARFIMENFLYAIGEAEALASEVQTKATGKTLEVTVEVTSYDKKVTDENTGIEKIITVPKNEVKEFNKVVSQSATNFSF